MPDNFEAVDLGTQAGAAELRLWRSALAMLVQDARSHWIGKQDKAAVYLEAFNDVCRCGAMVRWLCGMTGDSPEAVSEAFRGWCRATKAA